MVHSAGNLQNYAELEQDRLRTTVSPPHGPTEDTLAAGERFESK